VRFVQSTIDDFAAEAPATFDLIVLSDVLHHVPLDLRRGLLDTIRTLLAPGGSFAFKEWERTRTPIYWLCYFSDRWITGDRIRYFSLPELHEIISQSFGAKALVDERRIAPWRNNISALIRP
jgi:2-polyprenyl-6-hydroxyphenyl methylase/3-demethylubiquinone-9 3-methyltransferase